MRALLVVSKAQATVRALSIRKAGATTLTLLAVSLCGPEPGTVWRARRAVAFYDRRQDTRAGAELDPGPARCALRLHRYGRWRSLHTKTGPQPPDSCRPPSEFSQAPPWG